MSLPARSSVVLLTCFVVLALAVMTVLDFGPIFAPRGAMAHVFAADAPMPPVSPFHLPNPIRPDLPFDVDIDALRKLSSTPTKQDPPFAIPATNLPPSQRLFDVFAWRAFVSLNWPAKADGEPDLTKNLTDTQTLRVWEYYCEVGNVYREDGAAPLPWDKAVDDSWAKGQRTLWLHGMGIGKRKADKNPVLDESLQAFQGPMVDQQGHWVRYEIGVNRREFDYLVENKLYSLEGEAEFTAKNKITFPANDGTKSHGAIELKFAWKQLANADDRARFFARKAIVKRLDGTEFTADFGLVGMHIAARTVSSPTWIWATFEHIDNTTVNDFENDSKGRSLRPTFFNSDNPTKPVNVLAPKNSQPTARGNFTSWDESKTANPTQTLMVLPIPKATAALNAEAQAQLKQLGSVFRFYQLIGTQWPLEPDFPAFPNGVATQNDGRLLPSAGEHSVQGSWQDRSALPREYHHGDILSGRQPDGRSPGGGRPPPARAGCRPVNGVQYGELRRLPLLCRRLYWIQARLKRTFPRAAAGRQAIPRSDLRQERFARRDRERRL